MLLTVQKRDGSLEPFDSSKVFNAINAANAEVPSDEQVSDTDIAVIIEKLRQNFGEFVTVEEIQDFIESSLVKKSFNLGKKYILYRHTHSIIRNVSNTDASILSLVRNDNSELAKENANKNSVLAPSQRDLIAGEVSKDLTRRVLLPEKISKAHDEGILHFHDADYFLQPIFNCCLVNLGDMLDNSTVMSGKLIESPKSFKTACIVMAQIISTVANGQYGGQSLYISRLAPYLRRSKEKYIKKFSNVKNDNERESLIEQFYKEELNSGIQSLNYQITTAMSNGQTPFITLFMNINDNHEYIVETAQIIEEILTQRLQGIKNEKGQYVTPAFPKLIYVLDENNCLKGGEYDYLTKLAVKCSAKRLYPDYISAKKMRENYNAVFSCMGCRSFLSPWEDENGNYKWEGRFNQGVVSLNLPQIGILANGDETKFWCLLDERLSLCYLALLCRHKALLGTTSDISPIHFQYGAIARLKKGEKIDKLLKNGYSTLSLGYIGLYECVYVMKGISHTSPKGQEFALKIMNRLKRACEQWKEDTGLGFGLYGTPAESLCYRFARIDKERFGVIENITDKGYYTNSYHVDVRETIDAFSKLKFESQFQTISSGGAISYVEIPNMCKNLEALESIVSFIYDNIQYAEFNTKSDVCHICGFEGEMTLREDNTWVCPSCNNDDANNMTVPRRICGYIGLASNGINNGKQKEFRLRKLHVCLEGISQ